MKNFIKKYTGIWSLVLFCLIFLPSVINAETYAVKIKEYGIADLTVKVRSFGIADKDVCIKNPDDVPDWLLEMLD
jgi:hypothetical protein|tara:strand:+ start:127 stop:351 length:225 start_codon:yes stop_codon:yes gene_type:complete